MNSEASKSVTNVSILKSALTCNLKWLVFEPLMSMCRKFTAALNQINLERTPFFPLIKPSARGEQLFLVPVQHLSLPLDNTPLIAGNLPIPIMYHSGRSSKLWSKVQGGGLALLPHSYSHSPRPIP